MLPARYVFRRQNIKTNTTPLQIPCLIRDIGIPSTFSYFSFCSFFLIPQNSYIRSDDLKAYIRLIQVIFLLVRLTGIFGNDPSHH